jgi:hypothetical protein
MVYLLMTAQLAIGLHPLHHAYRGHTEDTQMYDFTGVSQKSC